MSFTRISIIVVLAALAVYFGLTYLLPHQKENLTNASGPTPDEVFASNTSATAPAQPDTAAVASAAETPAASATAPAEPSSTEAPKDVPATASSSESPKDNTAVASAGDTPKTAPAEAPSGELPKDTSMQTASSDSASTTAPAEQPVAATTASSDSSNEPAGTSDQDTAASSSRDSTAGSMTASPIKRHSHSKTAATSEMASSGEAESVESTRHSIHTKSSKPTENKLHNEFGDDAMYAWWPAADKQNSSRLNLVYGGEAAYAPAIVLLFSSDLSDAAAAGSHVQVYNRKGSPITQSWSLGNNPKMLVMKDVKPGRYTVVVGPEIADAQGKSLGTKLFGPVYVH